MYPQPHASILTISPYKAGKSSLAPGEKLVKLSSNENPLGPSPKAVEAYKSESTHLERYPDSSHLPLRQAIAEVYGLQVDRIVCGAGSDELIGMLIGAYAGEGDEVLYPEHGFLMYRIYALANGATPVTAPEVDLRTSVDNLLASVTPRTKLVFLANPNNPTGSYIPAHELKRLRAGLREDVLLVIDDAYCEYVMAADYSDGKELVESTENTVMLRTFSKIYGLPALRLGWGYFPPAVVDVLNRVRGPFNVGSAALAAGMAAVRDVEYTARCRRENAEERGRLAVALGAHFAVRPSEGNFLLVDFGTVEKAQAANAALMDKAIIVREVAAYGLAQFLRITVGTREENDRVIATLRQWATT